VVSLFLLIEAWDIRYCSYFLFLDEKKVSKEKSRLFGLEPFWEHENLLTFMAEAINAGRLAKVKERTI
jgi:hypothetical protein